MKNAQITTSTRALVVHVSSPQIDHSVTLPYNMYKQIPKSNIIYINKWRVVKSPFWPNRGGQTTPKPVH
jgi:hypothetical protein